MKAPLLVVLAALAASPAYADPRCGTLDHLPEIEARWNLAPRTATHHHGPKQVRDSFPGPWETLASDNFIVHWETGALLEANAQRVLDVLEHSWVVYHEELGHRIPVGADQFKVNAYVTGADDTPAIAFDGGYATLDTEGYPYFVLSLSMLASASPSAIAAMESVVAHEYYHDVQLSSGAFISYRWFFESTAEWGAMQAHPEASGPFNFSGAYLMSSPYALFHFQTAAGGPEGLHEYGAGLFWRFVTDTLDDKQMIVQTWNEAVPGQEPVSQVFSRHPAASLDDTFQAFIETSAFLDYPAAYRSRVLRSLGSISGMVDTAESAHVTAYVTNTGTPPGSRLERLQTYGFATIELATPSTGHFEIELALTGSEQVPSAALHASVVRSTAAGFTTEELAVSGTSSTVTIDFEATTLTTRLVVWVSSDERLNGKVFGLSYQVTPSEGEDPGDGDDTTDDSTDGDDTTDDAADAPTDGDDGGGCCSASSRGLPGSFALSLIGLALVRRRRRY